MRALAQTIIALLADRRGATAVEYGFILALIVLALIAGLTQLGTATAGLWSDLNTQVQQAN